MNFLVGYGLCSVYSIIQDIRYLCKTHLSVLECTRYLAEMFEISA